MTPFLRQLWVVSGVILNLVGQGFVLSYPYSLLPGLKRPGSGFVVDLDTAGWLASCIGIAGMLGFILSSVCMEWWGRRWAQIIAILPGILGWILIYFSKNVAMIMIGRVLCGVMAGASVTLGAIIIGEYTSPENRGLFLNFKTAATCLGVTSLHVLANYFDWREVALFAVIPLMAAILNIWTWRESPSWLVSKKRYSDSEDTFFYLQGRNEKTILDFDALIEGQKIKIVEKKTTFVQDLRDLCKKITEKDFIKPVLVIFFGISILEACGRHTFPAYAANIIEGMCGKSDANNNTFILTIAIDIITVVSATFSCFLVKIMKRRTLLFASGLSSLLVLSLVSLLVYLIYIGKIDASFGVVNKYLLILYFILVNLGCTPIPLAMLGELFPLRHRSAGTTVSGVAMSVSLLLFLKVTPAMLANIKVHGTFAVYAVILGVSLVYLYYMLPETKDRTLQDIEDYFNYGKFSEIKIKGDELRTLNEKSAEV